jgi:membrane associated rhomboid family serine protease
MTKQKFKFYFLWLSLICIGAFVLQNLPIFPNFTNTFILNNSVNDGQIWRYLTSIFLHGSLIHLMYNLFALLFFGLILEKTLGSKKFLTVFITSGILANIIAVNYYSSSLGASGAIYGILGCIAVLRPFMMVWAFGLILPMIIAVTLWIVADVLRVMGLFDPSNIGSIAHLSGVVIGILFGFGFKFFKNKNFNGEKVEKKIEVLEEYAEAWEKKFMS